MKEQQNIVVILSIIIIFLAVCIFMMPKSSIVVKSIENQEINTIKAEQGKTYAIDFKEKGILLEQTDIYTASGFYPITGKEYIDFDFKDLVVEQFNSFKESAIANADYPPFVDSDFKYYLNISYQTTENSDIIKSYIFSISDYSGGAHGMQNTISKTYNLETGELYTIEDILVNGTNDLPQISEIVRSELKAQFDKQNIPYDEDWINEGTSCEKGSLNFEVFALDSTSITFYFTPYQVAAYAYGTNMVSVPFSDIDNIIKTEFKN